MITLNGIPQTSLDLIRAILVNQMDLAPERVNIYDEKWKIPADEGVYLTLEYRNSKCISNRNVLDTSTTEPIEYQLVNMLENIVVGVFSRDRSATQRKEEVLMAIMSSYAEMMQEKYSFKISRIGSIDDLSALEGSAMLKRYDVNLTVYTWYQKTIVPGYIEPPFAVEVIANDPGQGKIISEFDQFTTQPN